MNQKTEKDSAGGLLRLSVLFRLFGFQSPFDKQHQAAGPEGKRFRNCPERIHPIHRADQWEELKKLPAQGTFEAGKVKNKRSKTTEEANEEFRNAFALQCIERTEVPVSDMAELLGLAPRTVRDRVKALAEEFHLENGMVKRGKALENKASKTKKRSK